MLTDLERAALTLALEDKLKKLCNHESHAKEGAARLLSLHADANTWLNDTIIDCFFESLQHVNPAQKITSFSCFDTKGAAFNNLLEGKKKWHQKKKQELKEADLIFMPISEGSHWYLLSIRKILPSRQAFTKPLFSVKVLDGFNHTSKHQSYFAQGIRLLTALYGDKGFELVKEPYTQTITPQNNIIDCGPVIGFFAQKMCQGEAFPLVEEGDYGFFRIAMGNAIIGLPEKPAAKEIPVSDDDEVEFIKEVSKPKANKTQEELLPVVPKVSWLEAQALKKLTSKPKARETQAKRLLPVVPKVSWLETALKKSIQTKQSIKVPLQGAKPKLKAPTLKIQPAKKISSPPILFSGKLTRSTVAAPKVELHSLSPSSQPKAKI